jgi:hypothetical protein
MELDYVTSCNHKFHKECIMLWFTSLEQRVKTCPVCRFIIDTPTVIIIDMSQSRNYRPPVQYNIYIIFATIVFDSIFLWLYFEFKNYIAIIHQLLIMFIIVNMFLICQCRFQIIRC